MQRNEESPRYWGCPEWTPDLKGIETGCIELVVVLLHLLTFSQGKRGVCSFQVPSRRSPTGTQKQGNANIELTSLCHVRIIPHFYYMGLARVHFHSAVSIPKEGIFTFAVCHYLARKLQFRGLALGRDEMTESI